MDLEAAIVSAIPLIAALVAAASGYLAFKYGVRQRAWQTVYEDKRTKILHFLALHSELSELWSIAAATQKMSASQKQDEILFGAIATQLQRDPSERELNAKNLALLRSEILARVSHSYFAMGKAYTELSILLYNPGGVARVRRLALRAFNGLLGTRNGQEFDFEKFRTDWNEARVPCLVSLREDLRYSAKSWWRATRISPKWKRERD